MTDYLEKETNSNPFHAPVKSESGVVQVEQNRAIQEVQAAMVVAKKFPRDQHAAFNRIMTACERPVLAEAASYSYPKGGKKVEGPTIRLAEVLAQNWGNMEFGIRELSQDSGASEVQAFAWDLETNVRQSKTFLVPHKMKAHGTFKILTDPRDIYEHTANMGARRLRACILGIIPGDIVDAAVVKCEETLKKGDGKPLEDRVRGMLERFKEIEISQELIEKRLQHKTTAIVRSQLVELGKIYNSIKDGMSKRSDWFDVPGQRVADTSGLSDKIKQQKTEKKEEKPPAKIDDSKPGEIKPPETIDEKQEKPEPQKTEEEKLPRDETADFRNEWISMRGPGFSTFVHKNKNRFEKASPEIQEEAQAKWEKLYPATPWPIEKKETPHAANSIYYSDEYQELEMLKVKHPNEYDTIINEKGMKKYLEDFNVSREDKIGWIMNRISQIDFRVDEQKGKELE